MRIKSQYSTKKRIVELIKNLREIDKAISNDNDCIDLDEVEWIYPISFLPIVVCANHNNISIDSHEEDHSICNYLESICFPEGTTDLSRVHKDYLPITKLACTNRNDILSRYEDRIITKVPSKYRTPFLHSLKYLTSELEANVREHANVKNYWILSQYWKASPFNAWTSESRPT